MNERTKELAEQAGFDIEQTMYGLRIFFDDRGVTEELERFAELIRQDECNKFVNFLMDLHAKYEGNHNYYHCAANLFKEQA